MLVVVLAEVCFCCNCLTLLRAKQEEAAKKEATGAEATKLTSTFDAFTTFEA